MHVIVAVLIGLGAIVGCYADANATNIDKLKKDLLTNYDRLTRPEQYKTKTLCHAGLALIHLDLDETRGVLTSHVWMRMNWSDSKLTWDNRSYDGISELHFSADEIWQPDLTVYNSAEANIVEHYAKTNKIVYSSGNVLWVPTAKFETYCAMDLKLWPFDVQNCSIKIGSWTYSGHQIDLQIADSAADITEYYHENSEWKILKTGTERHTKYYACCPDPYIDLTFNLLIQRRSPMFKAIVITPAIVVVFMTLASFWLPPQSGEKLLLNGIACVVICILLMFFSQLLPILAASPPLIVTFYSHTLYLLCVSLIISIIVINISRNRKQYAVPHSIKENILEGFIGKILGGVQPEPLNNGNHAEELKETPFEEHRSSDDHQIIQTSLNAKSTVNQNSWIQLAIIIDRITFFIYVFIFIVMGFLHFI